jgi:hypothetical protein
MKGLRWLQWAGLPLGIAILIGLVLHEGAGGLIQVIGQAGFALLWLVPFHALPLLLDAYAWHLLLGRRVSLLFLWWVATVREAVSRLLPVAGIGGEIVGIRLARWRVADLSGVSASVIVEVMVTMAVQYVFSALGLVLIVASTHQVGVLRTVGLALVLSLPLPVMAVVLVRRGGVFHAVERWAGSLLGASSSILHGMDGRQAYWALELLGHPVSLGGALAIEGLTQAVRHAAFFVPAGLGVQDAAVVVLAQMFGVDREVAFSLALVKRMREVLFGCGALVSWQVVEVWRRWGVDGRGVGGVGEEQV